MMLDAPSAARSPSVPAAPAWALVLGQMATVLAAVGYELSPAAGPTDSDAHVRAEFASFFVVPLVWLALFVAGLWMLRRPRGTRTRVALLVGTAASGTCAVVGIAFAMLLLVGGVLLTASGF
ncbi:MULTISPECIES: hypothetical protein [unclassified Nocardioides]|uniref:hypothetical protein n=1 Tax=unclassified Nocardioides TaxID=2615069 RepID=UPI0007027CAA|nr:MULTISPECIES: hypothetical protein [unclassified Nocardioides]KRC58861.1 hypothetical protein ASE19_22610 [Nocardioides sp. Root79]KRC76816.1 hypothetical protein ASE20_00730 [Nocardioides sp. Root240]